MHSWHHVDLAPVNKTKISDPKNKLLVEDKDFMIEDGPSGQVSIRLF